MSAMFCKEHEEDLMSAMDCYECNGLCEKIANFIKELGYPYTGEKIRLSDLEAKGTILYDHYIDYGIGTKVILTDDKAWLLYNNNSHFPPKYGDN